MKQLIKQLLSEKNLKYTDINELKKKYADKHKSKLPLNSTILEAATPEQRKRLVKFLKEVLTYFTPLDVFLHTPYLGLCLVF